MKRLQRWILAGWLGWTLAAGAALAGAQAGVAQPTVAQPVAARPAEAPFLSRVVTGKDIDQLSADLIRAIGNHNYTYVRQQAIDARLVPQAWEAKTVRIVYFCNFAKMERALNIDARAAQFLPCRVTLAASEHGILMTAVNPAWASSHLGNPLLHRDCQMLKQDYLDILDEAAL